MSAAETPSASGGDDSFISGIEAESPAPAKGEGVDEEHLTQLEQERAATVIQARARGSLARWNTAQTAITHQSKAVLERGKSFAEIQAADIMHQEQKSETYYSYRTTRRAFQMELEGASAIGARMSSFARCVRFARTNRHGFFAECLTTLRDRAFWKRAKTQTRALTLTLALTPNHLLLPLLPPPSRPRVAQVRAYGDNSVHRLRNRYTGHRRAVQAKRLPVAKARRRVRGPLDVPLDALPPFHQLDVQEGCERRRRERQAESAERVCNGPRFQHLHDACANQPASLLLGYPPGEGRGSAR